MMCSRSGHCSGEMGLSSIFESLSSLIIINFNKYQNEFIDFKT